MLSDKRNRWLRRKGSMRGEESGTNQLTPRTREEHTNLEKDVHDEPFGVEAVVEARGRVAADAHGTLRDRALRLGARRAVRLGVLNLIPRLACCHVRKRLAHGASAAQVKYFREKSKCTMLFACSVCTGDRFLTFTGSIIVWKESSIAKKKMQLLFAWEQLTITEAPRCELR